MVGRMIKRARDEGLIEVVPKMIDPIDVKLSSALASKFKLQAAYAVVPAIDTLEQTRSTISAFAAKVLAETVQEDDTIGLAAGRTILEMCTQISELPTCDIVQITGVATTDANESMHAVMTLSSIARGRMYPLHAPFVTTDARAGEAIAAQPGVKQALNRMNGIDKAVLSVGGFPNDALLAEQARVLGELDRLAEAGLVAEIGTTLLDADGNPLDVLAGRMVGITTEQLRQVPLKLVVAGTEGKHRAILAALRAGLVDVLVTDANTARFVLENA